jgi:hypothetical protein
MADEIAPNNVPDSKWEYIKQVNIWQLFNFYNNTKTNAVNFQMNKRCTV